MAKSNAVWGIDIGQCALKALHCHPHDTDSNRIVADAHDYIEYDKILCQPDAEPDELIAEALKTFLSRNDVKNDQVAISVSGQNGLTRFIKLPPVESKQVPNIVKYEAKQQIPFSLDEVEWRYQQMPGGSEEDGFSLEAEVGLFAMKRDQVFKALRPLEDAGIEVDLIQLSPLAIYNYISKETFQIDPEAEYDPDDPPESLVVLAVGTEATDLVVTNGYRIWHRNIPLGGNHFTKSLTKNLKLTFTKAEQLKRNAAKAEDPKAIFRAMRPVFGDMLTEIQTSIRFFQNVDKTAKLGKIVVMGNAMKLPGLRRYLKQNLGMEVVEMDSYHFLSGNEVLNSPSFKDNRLSFGVAYGVALQVLGHGAISINLLPEEINTARRIREKKPWAIAAVALLLFGCTVNMFAGPWGTYLSTSKPEYDAATKKVKSVGTQEAENNKQFEAELAKLKQQDDRGEEIVQNIQGRTLWVEMLMAINYAQPRDNPSPDLSKPLSKRAELRIEVIRANRRADFSDWYQGPIKKAWDEAHPDLAGEPSGDAGGTSGGNSDSGNSDSGGGNSGSGSSGNKAGGNPGYVVEIRGHSYNDNADRHLKDNFIVNLAKGEMTLDNRTFTMQQIGIKKPVLAFFSDKDVDNPLYDEDATKGGDNRQPSKIRRHEFIVQFWWEPTPLRKRLSNSAADSQTAQR